MILLVGIQQLTDAPATIYQIHEESLIQATVPDAALGRVTASLRVIGWTAMLCGTIVGGLLGETIGPRDDDADRRASARSRPSSG